MENVRIFRETKDDRGKLLNACKAFACESWIAVYVETSDSADIYLTSLTNYDEKYAGTRATATHNWQMTAKAKQAYEKDADVRHIRMEFHQENWNWTR